MYGAVAIEYAFVLPALLLFLLGILECGRLFWSYTTLYRATEAAARCGAIMFLGLPHSRRSWERCGSSRPAGMRRGSSRPWR
jgi:hypothetical protein